MSDAMVRYVLALSIMVCVIAILNEQGKLMGGIFMNDDDWKQAGVMIRYNANSKFVEVEPEGLNSLLRDQARLEWLASNECHPMKTKHGWQLTFEGNVGLGSSHFNSWRDAIDNAMADALTVR